MDILVHVVDKQGVPYPHISLTLTPEISPWDSYAFGAAYTTDSNGYLSVSDNQALYVSAAQDTVADQFMVALGHAPLAWNQSRGVTGRARIPYGNSNYELVLPRVLYSRGIGHVEPSTEGEMRGPISVASSFYVAQGFIMPTNSDVCGLGMGFVSDPDGVIQLRRDNSGVPGSIIAQGAANDWAQASWAHFIGLSGQWAQNRDLYADICANGSPSVSLVAGTRYWIVYAYNQPQIFVATFTSGTVAPPDFGSVMKSFDDSSWSAVTFSNTYCTSCPILGGLDIFLTE